MTDYRVQVIEAENGEAAEIPTDTLQYTVLAERSPEGNIQIACLTEQ